MISPATHLRNRFIYENNAQILKKTVYCIAYKYTYAMKYVWFADDASVNNRDVSTVHFNKSKVYHSYMTTRLLRKY